LMQKLRFPTKNMSTNRFGNNGNEPLNVVFI
jgi:hypothetical protein